MCFLLLTVQLYDLFYPFLCSSFLNSRYFMRLLISQVIAVAKSSDLVLMVLDASKVSIYIIIVVFGVEELVVLLAIVW